MNRDDLKSEVISRVQGEGAITLLSALGHKPVKKGREWVMLCPYHSDHKPSFTINLPGQKSPNGIFFCQACKSGGDIFKFIEDTQGFESFKDTLDFLAAHLGLDVKAPAPTRQQIVHRESVKSTGSELMPPAEVFQVFRTLRDGAIPPEPYANGLGLPLWAWDRIDTFVTKMGKDRATGVVRAGQGCTVMVTPMRAATGEMCSIRFRSLERRKPGEKSRRWSLDQNKPDSDDQAKYTNSGLMLPKECFEGPPRKDQISVLLEGETDLSAGVAMMEPYGSDPLEWPVRWIALPGVNNCHDLLTRDLVGDYLCTFMDADRAGRGAVFDYKERMCEMCARRVPVHNDFCRHRPPGDERECGGRALINVKGALLPGLLSKQQKAGVRAMAAFPPAGESKVDLRDLYRAGWDWPRFFDHLLNTATKRTRANV